MCFWMATAHLVTWLSCAQHSEKYAGWSQRLAGWALVGNLDRSGCFQATSIVLTMLVPACVSISGISGCDSTSDCPSQSPRVPESTLFVKVDGMVFLSSVQWSSSLDPERRGSATNSRLTQRPWHPSMLDLLPAPSYIASASLGPLTSLTIQRVWWIMWIAWYQVSFNLSKPTDDHMRWICMNFWSWYRLILVESATRKMFNVQWAHALEL